MSAPETFPAVVMPPASAMYTSPPPPFAAFPPSSAVPPPPTAYMSSFPPTFGIYRQHSSEWAIRLHQDDAPLFSIETHSGWSGKPSLVLRSNGGQAINAAAQMHDFSSKTQISIDGFPECEFLRQGHLRTSYRFSIPLPGGAGTEEFEWRKGNSAQLEQLGGRGGMELVRMRTGQAVAVWSRVSLSLRKKGKMAWIVGPADLAQMGGLMLEVVAVMVVLCVLEKEKRQQTAGGGAGG